MWMSHQYVAANLCCRYPMDVMGGYLFDSSKHSIMTSLSGWTKKATDRRTILCLSSSSGISTLCFWNKNMQVYWPSFTTPEVVNEDKTDSRSYFGGRSICIFSFIHIHTKHVLHHEKIGNNQKVEITSQYTWIILTQVGTRFLGVFR